MKSLPNPIKPSALIRLALGDEEKAHASNEYRVDMGDWHYPNTTKCSVCFAGAVMAFSLGADARTYIQPQGFDVHTSNCLLALNSFRTGRVYEGLHTMGLSDMEKEDSHRKLDRYVRPYSKSRDAFRAAMEKLAEELEMIGL